MRTLAPLVGCVALAAASSWGAAAWHNVVNRACVSDVAVVGDEIWLGFLGGAARYEPLDGRVSFYTAAEGLVHNYITALAADEGAVYFASRNGVGTFHGAALTRNVRLWGYGHNDCADVAADKEYVYVATREGARRYDKAFGEIKFEPVPKEEGPADKLSPQIEDGWKVYVNPDGVVLDDLYSVTLGDGVIYWGGRGRLFASAPGAERWRELDVTLPTLAVVRRVLARGDALVLLTDAGVYEYADDQTSLLGGPLAGADARDALAFGGLEYYATAGGLFVRRADGKEFKFKAGTPAGEEGKKKKRKKAVWWRLGAANGLPSDRVTALATWGESVVVGTENGACLLEPGSGKTHAVPIPHGLPAGGVYALAYGAGKIWAATPEGMAAIDDDDYAVEKYPPSPLGMVVKDVVFADGELVVVTPGGVTAAAPGGAARTFLLKDAGLGGEARRALMVGEEYFLGTSEGLVELDGGLAPVRVYGPADGFPAAPVRAMLLWGRKVLCGTQGGGLAVLDLDGDAVRVLKENAGLSSDIIFSLAVDDERVYVGTFDKGVDILGRDLSFQRNISWGDGLSHTDIWAEAVADGWLWLGIRGVGVNAVNLASLTAMPKDGKNGSKGKPALEVRRYYARYGLGDEYVRAVWPLPPKDGMKRVAFGTASGVALLEYDGAPPDYTADDFDRNYP